MAGNEGSGSGRRGQPRVPVSSPSPAAGGAEFDIVLRPLSPGELNEIRIDHDLTIGRTAPPFESYAHQVVSQLSRLHARIYRSEGSVWLADLGSRNGTSVNGVAIKQTPCKLNDGDQICLGGQLNYRISIHPRASPDSIRLPVIQSGGSVHAVQAARAAQPEPSRAAGQSVVLDMDDVPPTESKFGVPKTPPPGDDKTRFVDSPTSFLKLFSNAAEPKASASSGSAVVIAEDSRPPVVRARGPLASLLREFILPDAGDEHDLWRRFAWKAAATVIVLSALALTAYFWNAPERALKDAIAREDYPQAATLTDRLLRKHPEDVQLRAQDTDAALKANVPLWLAKIRARDFPGANAVLAGLSRPGTPDTDLQTLKSELQWVGDLEQLISNRSGPEAPIRIYSDEDSIAQLMTRWNEDTGEHQRNLAIIAAHVPDFGVWYGEALTHIRKLQSESAVYLPVLQRLKGEIDTDLQRDDLRGLEATLAQTADKYPALGLASVQQDLARYVAIQQEARTRTSGRLFALLRSAHLATPPFQQSLQSMIDSAQLPSAQLQQQYAAATQAWENGAINEALAALQPLTNGPWGTEAAAELDRRRTVAARFAALSTARSADNFVDQLLTFVQSLDADEDSYFSRATAADLKQQQDTVLARAQDSMTRARSLWQEYRSNGAINAAQRVENAISTEFRTRARLLALARQYAQQGFVIYSQVDAAPSPQWSTIRGDIESEAMRQRDGLNELANVMAPELLRAKLVLIGEGNP